MVMMPDEKNPLDYETLDPQRRRWRIWEYMPWFGLVISFISGVCLVCFQIPLLPLPMSISELVFNNVTMFIDIAIGSLAAFLGFIVSMSWLTSEESPAGNRFNAGFLAVLNAGAFVFFLKLFI